MVFITSTKEQLKRKIDLSESWLVKISFTGFIESASFSPIVAKYSLKQLDIDMISDVYSPLTDRFVIRDLFVDLPVTSLSTLNICLESPIHLLNLP